MTIETSGRLPATHDISPTDYAPPRVAWEDYVRWALASESPSEWVDGEIVEIMPPNVRHQFLVRFLFKLMDRIAGSLRSGEVMFEVQMRLRRRPSGRTPDIIFVANEHLDRLRLTSLEGPADIAVEVVSPDSEVRDRREKYLEYEAAGIPEYWLIDDLRREANFFTLGADGLYQAAVIDEDGTYTSTVLPGLRLDVEWLWRDPLPTLEEALAELG